MKAIVDAMPTAPIASRITPSESVRPWMTSEESSCASIVNCIVASAWTSLMDGLHSAQGNRQGRVLQVPLTHPTLLFRPSFCDRHH